jgi:hypothetical protein
MNIEWPLLLNVRARDIALLGAESHGLLYDVGGERILLFVFTPRM